MRRLGFGLALTAGLTLAGASGVAAESFIASIWYPQSHPLDRYGYEHWAEELAERSNGELTADVYYGESLLPAKAHLSGLQDGIAQLTHHAGTYTPSEMPEDSVIAMIAMGLDNTMAAAMAMTEFGLTDEEMQARYDTLGVTFLGAFSTPQYILMCKEPIQTLADLEGVKIRTPGAVQADWARSVGAVPVTVPSTEMYTGLEKGQLDCAANAANDLRDRSLWDVAKHTNMISIGLYFHGWQYAFNRDYWSSLSAEHRRLLMDTIAEAIPKTAIGYIKQSEDALAEAPDHGVTIHQPEPEVQQSVFDFVSSTGVDTAIEVGTDRFGMEDPGGLLERFQAVYDKYVGLLEEVDPADEVALADLLKNEVFNGLDEATYGVN